MINRTLKDTNYFCKHFQDNIKVFNTKAQVYNSRLKSSPKPSKVGYIIYIAKTLQLK